MATPTVNRHTNYSYDAVTGGISRVNTNEGIVNHAYDPVTGRLTRTWTGNYSIAYASTLAVSDTLYDYDALGRLWHVTVDRRNGSTPTVANGNNIIFSTPEVTTYGYDGVGDLASVTLPTES